jgi:hypothetical protein
MSDVYGPIAKARGCFFALQHSLKFGKGAILVLPGGGSMPAGAVDQYLVIDVQFSQREKFHLLQCFAERAYLYAFGHDASVSTARVTFMAFLIQKGGGQVADVLSTFRKNYSAARVSRSTKLATIQIGSNSIQGFVVGLSSSTADAHHNLQTFTVDLLIIEDPKAAQAAAAGAGGGGAAAAGGGSFTGFTPLQGTGFTPLQGTGFTPLQGTGMTFSGGGTTGGGGAAAGGGTTGITGGTIPGSQAQAQPVPGGGTRGTTGGIIPGSQAQAQPVPGGGRRGTTGGIIPGSQAQAQPVPGGGTRGTTGGIIPGSQARAQPVPGGGRRGTTGGIVPGSVPVRGAGMTFGGVTGAPLTAKPATPSGSGTVNLRKLRQS